MTMQTAELTKQHISEDELVRRCRVDQLRRAGYPARAASAIGGRRDVDLHLAIDLLRHGCRPALAVRILL